MTEEAYKRSLTIIPSEDLADDSRLMPEIEAATVCTLTTYLKTTTHLIHQNRVRETDSIVEHLLVARGALQGNSVALMGIRGEPCQS